MNKIIILLLLSFNLQAQFIPSIIGSVNYDRKIRKAAPAYERPAGVGGFTIRFRELETPSMGDLREILEPYTEGQIIDIQKIPLAARTGQAFYISANATNVVLQYTTPQSLDNAIYTYLEMLGVHWYGPGVNWFIKQAVLNVPIIAGAWTEPTFRSRTFFGTGGLDSYLSIDPTFEYKKNWYAFKRRNKFNSDFADPSHVGQAFYINNVALCDAHPEWFTNQLGKESGRIRVEIPAAVQAYKDWYARTPNLIDSFVTINVDPEDGRGGADDPLPPSGFNGITNWNHSDKWWYFANEIANGYDSNNVRIRIGALAYGDGPTITLVPKFPLKKNVFPVLTPYAFQTAYLPKQMVKEWHRNTPGYMGMYDYWNITQWSLGLPQFNIYTIPQKLSFWGQNAIKSVAQETTDGAGATGHMFWLMGQLEFDTTKNFDTLYKRYLVDCFGNGAKPMKNMYDRWSLNYQNSQDVSFTLKDLKDATDSVVVNSPQWKRINDLKAYSHFMKLMAKRTNIQSNNDSIYQYMYSIHQRMLVQTSAFIGQRYLSTLPPAPLSAHQLTEQEIETNFAADMAALPVEYTLSTMVFDFNNATYIDSIPLESWRYGIFAGAEFKPKYTGTFSVNMGGEGTTKVKIFTDDSVYVDESVTPTNFTFNEFVGTDKWYMKNYVINVVQGRTYTLSTIFGFGRVRVKTPNIVLFTKNEANDFDNYAYPLRYFYVPLGTTKIAYTDGDPQSPALGGYLIPPGGTGLVRTPTSVTGVYTVNVPAGKDGQVWTAQFGHSGWFFNNIPNYSTLQKFSYNEFP